MIFFYSNIKRPYPKRIFFQKMFSFKLEKKVFMYLEIIDTVDENVSFLSFFLSVHYLTYTCFILRALATGIIG